MLLTLVDSLRCPAPHEETSLVLSVRTWDGQRIMEGELGCPTCHARYRIRQGAVEFAPDRGSVRPGNEPVDPLRLAAQLALTEPGGIVLLTGKYAAVSDQLAQLVEATYVLLDGSATAAPTAVNILAADRLPFVDGALRGAAIDGHRGSPEFMAETARCTRAGGRLLAPEDAPLPNGLHLLARDESEWVGEILDLSAPISLRRAGPRNR